MDGWMDPDAEVRDVVWHRTII